MSIKKNRKKIKLNVASLDVWGQHLATQENTEISERIIELDMKENLTKEEGKELAMLVKMEQSLLSKSVDEVNKNKLIISQYYMCLDRIKHDERLTTLFNVRFGDAMNTDEILTPEDVIKVFHKMMEVEMEIDGHEKLNKEYKEIKHYIDNNVDPVIANSCKDPDCLYCADIHPDEYAFSMKRLESEGYIDSQMTEQEKMLKLMCQVIRLEMLLDEIEGLEEGDEDDED